ncbi:hypothetical protein [uncultured Tateyamaria sp.]|uniref:hypothetical protein n=1 Tax=uncultured Tateyamaria sp. TaxID=455651 RepID=UPI0026270BDD|nr:hypothetical protein [uncultured Tateyamaria sp.]
MKRLKERAEASARYPASKDDPSIRGDDDFLCYCLWAHSMREWIRHDCPKIAEDLDKQLFQEMAWDMCRGIANRVRHFDQLKFPPKDKYWRLFCTYDPLAKIYSNEAQIEWVLYYNKRRYTVSSVIRMIDEMWANALASIGLDPNEVPDEMRVSK